MEMALAEIARIPASAPLDEVFRRTTELAAEALEVERVGVWLFIDGRTVLRCASLFERSRGEHSFGCMLQVEDFPAYFASLKARKSVPAEDAVDEPWTTELTAEYLEPLGITSMLDAGIFVDGTMVGVVCHEHVGSPPREWTDEARDFVAALADLLALRIQAAEARELRTTFLQQQKRLAAQAKLSAMEELTAGIAHDFKNLLMTIRIYGRLLSERRELPEDAREQASEIVAAVDRGAELARELMEFARPTFSPPAVIDPAEVTAAYLPELREVVGAAYHVRYHNKATVGRILVDRTQFTRMLRIVVTNAAEAMPKGGSIKIRLAPVRLRGHNHGAGRYVLVEVADAGVGMDEATLARVFEPYYTTKPKGTGLGLPIVQQVIERVGGFVRVESVLGRGTTVRMYFPTIRAGQAEGTAP
jgi:signal transduction histidine kinase